MPAGALPKPWHRGCRLSSISRGCTPLGKAQTTHAYMNLTSSEGAMLLERAFGRRAARIHCAPRAVRRPPASALPAKSEVALAPGHDHLALTGLTRTLKIGDRVNITLVVRTTTARCKRSPVNAEVRHRSPVDDERRAHHH